MKNKALLTLLTTDIPKPMRIAILFVLVLFLCGASLSLAPAPVTAAQNPSAACPVFGPADFVRARGAPRVATRSFAAPQPGSGLLRIYNGGRSGQFGRVSSAQVTLNERLVAGPSDFNQGVQVIERPVSLESSNTLAIMLASAPGAGFTLEVYGGVDNTTCAVIGPGGGTLASADGRVRLDFPPGAVAADTVITAVPRAVPADAGFVGNLVYELGPDGLVFARPVRLTLGYDPAALSVPEATLRIGKLIEGGVGEFAADPMVDTTRHTVAGSLSRFSSYGATGGSTAFSFSAELQGDRSIRVSWTSWGGSLSVERATCIFPQVCGNPAPTQPPDSSFSFFASGASGDLQDRSVPSVSAIYWYRIRNSTRVFATQFVVIFGLPTPPGPPTGFTATPEPDGDILLTWDRSAESDVSFVITREVCGAEELLTELPGQATSFTDDRAFGLAPGARYTYRLSRRNSVGTSGPVSAAATSAVGPAECQFFTLSLTNCDIAVPSGGSGTVEVQIRRAGGFPLPVTLSLEPLGNFNAVLDHSFAPETSIDGNSILTLRDLGGSARVSAIIRGRDVTGASCFTPISVHFTGNAVPVTLTTYQGRTQANALWAAKRLGDGPWEPIFGTGGRYEFTVSSVSGGRYSVAVACDETAVTILELTTSETTEPVVGCSETNEATHLVQGAFQNLPANHCVRGAVGDRSLASCYTQSYAAYVPAATHDIIATIHPLIGGGQSDNAPDAIRIVRDVQITGPTNFPLDLASAVAATPGLVQITPSAVSSSVAFRTANRARAVLGFGALNATQFSFGGVPFASQRAGDIHELSTSRMEETRRIFFRAPADHLVDFSNPLAWSVTTLSNAGSSAHRRITLTADRVAGVSGYEIVFDSFDPMMETDPRRRWTSFVSTGWLDANGLGSPFAYTTADLGAAPGFDANWGLHTQPSAQTSYTIRAHLGSGTLTTLLQVIAGEYGSVSHGYVLRSAVRNGNVP